MSQVGSTPQAEKFGHTLATAQLVRDMARNSRPDIHVSYSPSPLDFAREKHNVDWVDWLVNGVVMEVREAKIDVILIHGFVLWYPLMKLDKFRYKEARII